MNKTENKLVPELRFSEFLNNEGWKEVTIGDIAKVNTGNKDTQNKVENGQYPFFVRSQTVESINSFSYDGEAILTSGDGVGVGKNFHYIKGKFDYHQRVYCIYDFKDEVIGKFIFMYFSKHFDDRVRRMSAKNSVDSVRMAMITEMPLNLPEKQEQQKIADCLSSLDELITSQHDKLEALKNHKKGLLQNLFPQEGETVPKFRFPEFVNDIEWEEIALGNLTSNISSGKDKNSSEGIYNLYGSTGIIGKSNTSSYNGNFILVARVGANAGLLNRVNGNFGVTDNTLVINLKKINTIDFIFYALEKANLNNLVFGSGQPLITGSQLKKMELLLPPSEIEQLKIAQCLSEIDNLIMVQTNKIEQLKDHKKGLMQRLFPQIA